MKISSILNALFTFALKALAREAASELTKSLKQETKALDLEAKIKVERDKAAVNIKNAERVESIVSKLKEVII